MQVGAGHPACCADFADLGSGGNPLAACNSDFAQVAVHGYQALAVIYEDGITIEVKITRYRNYSFSCCCHGLARWRGDVHTAVWRARFVIEEAAQAET